MKFRPTNDSREYPIPDILVTDDQGGEHELFNGLGVGAYLFEGRQETELEARALFKTYLNQLMTVNPDLVISTLDGWKQIPIWRRQFVDVLKELGYSEQLKGE